MNDTTSDEISAAAIAFVEASKCRSLARTNLAKRRKAWHEENESYYTTDECEDEEGADEMEAALAARIASQRAFSAARSRLFRIVRSST